MFRKQIKQEGLNKEMELARDFQEALIPKKSFTTEKYEIDTYYQPHFNIGGDYIDYIKFSENRFAVVIADISGKGVAAALLMSNFQAMLQSLIFQYRDLETFVFALNQAVHRTTKSDKFITFFIAEIDTDKMEMSYINAGHFPPLLYTSGKIEELQKGSTIIGAFEKLPFINEGKVKLGSDAMLFCFTDGLVDVTNGSGEYFDEEKLKSHIIENKDKGAAEFNKSIIKELEHFKGANDYVDDIAILTTKIY
ncbi:MAG: hypothetical protein EBY37_09245 [Flavobacteriia bacterium]|nr:hypothetical protein [Flavobacteriia bacterium]